MYRHTLGVIPAKAGIHNHREEFGEDLQFALRDGRASPIYQAV